MCALDTNQTTRVHTSSGHTHQTITALLAQVAPNGTVYTAPATVPGQIHLDLEAAGIIPPTYVVPIIHICHFELNVQEKMVEWLSRNTC